MTAREDRGVQVEARTLGDEHMGLWVNDLTVAPVQITEVINPDPDDPATVTLGVHLPWLRPGRASVRLRHERLVTIAKEADR